MAPGEAEAAGGRPGPDRGGGGNGEAGRSRPRAGQPPLGILTMAAVVALTVRVTPGRGPAGSVVQVPLQGASPVIVAPPSVTLVPLASPGCAPASVMTCTS